PPRRGAQQHGGRDGQRQKVDVTIGDFDGDDDISFFQPDDEPRSEPRQPEAHHPASRIEWTQEPAMRAMQEELKTLRSLFQDQLQLMEWHRMGQQQPVRTSLLKRLNGLGLGNDVCRKLADRLGTGEDPDAAWRRALGVIAKNLPVNADDIVDQGGIVAVVGPTGVGKTTTVAKLAARYALRHGHRHVALVSTDNFRIGGQDQLRNFARILGVPVHTAGSREELGQVLEELADKRLVLVDTAGMSQRDMRLNEQLQTLSGAHAGIRTYLLLSATTQLSTLAETVKAFRHIKPAGCIVSKVDEATSLGGVLTVLLRSQLKVAYLGTGQRVPEDLQPARREKLVETACRLSEAFQQDEDEETLALSMGGRAHAGI
ncbi:flagellar biosynthesis protein FlhF, partial [Ectothiorhodospiraceae bacterium WFHF3C12]|nr:flagellar biosynthesis protein FlhF [Ectothiorhodospiraceae bacterium WFHF3C12]